jgi:hypothetical protein
MPPHAFAFIALLAITSAYARGKHLDGLALSALVTLGNCLVGSAVVLTTGDYTPWQLFLALNIASAWLVLLEPAHRPQAIVAGMYVALACLDAVFGIVGSSDSAWSYIFVSAVVGWGQLSVLAIGAIDDDNGTSRIARWLGGNANPDPAPDCARVEVQES